MPNHQSNLDKYGPQRYVLDASASIAIRERLAARHPDIGDIWELCSRAEFDRDRLVKGLKSWLGPPDGRRIIDCACGAGFPALDLVASGYNLTCSDGSSLMLDRFRQNARQRNLAIEPIECRWEALGQRFFQNFDLAMCRGSSLIYAGTWDNDATPDHALLVSSITGIAACVRPTGSLYVDTTRTQDLQTEHRSSHLHFILDDGNILYCDEMIENDFTHRVRTWSVRLRLDPLSCGTRRRSHLLMHDELVQLLQNAGFKTVTRAHVDGEYYDGFVASKSIDNFDL
jgi:SAM-dependent methyltransferase